VHKSAGVFALKEIEITTGREFRFYYAFQAAQQGALSVTAVSSLQTKQGQSSLPLATTVMPLGTIDGISVGLIRVQFLDQGGQTITLQVTSSAESGVQWQLTPLRQLVAEPHPEGGGFYRLPVDQELFPAIIWSGPYSKPGVQPMVSLLRDTTGAHAIFLEVDYTGKVAVITREQCLQMANAQICQ
jgi:hypothetical protein